MSIRIEGLAGLTQRPVPNFYIVIVLLLVLDINPTHEYEDDDDHENDSADNMVDIGMLNPER